MNGINSNMLSIEQATNLLLQNSQKKADNYHEDKNISFQEILEQKANVFSEVKFSKHANQRLESRNINLSKEQLGRLNQGVTQARDKSINESLVMMDNLAFIVNVKNNTVVTALEQSEQNNIFTNIDGAVIV
ncbi:MAG: flagellar protein [Lachnospiraceae bacterium]|nr:flagellar protein [Lachnospiraceae bacterium]